MVNGYAQNLGFSSTKGYTKEKLTEIRLFALHFSIHEIAFHIFMLCAFYSERFMVSHLQ